MQITFLGTGTSIGIPVPCCHCDVCRSSDPRDHRLRSSLLVDTDSGARLLIDCGPDFRMQMLTHHIDHLDAILLTHLHYDHASAFDDLRPYAKQRLLEVCAEPRVVESLREKYDYIFVHTYPGAPRLELRPIDPDSSLTLEGETIVPIRLMHGNLPILGYRIGPMAYLTDCSAIPESEYDKLQGLRLLIIDALRHREHPTHFSIEEAIAAAQRIGAQETLFTHISHEMGLHESIAPTLPEGITIAHDGLTIRL